MKQKGYKDLGFDVTYAKAHKEGKKVEVEFFLFSLLIPVFAKWAIQFLDKRRSCRKRILGPVRMESVKT